MDLLGALSKSEMVAKLSSLSKLRKKLLHELAPASRQSTPLPLRPGELSEAIAKVLVEATEPVHLTAIRHAVERRLDRPVNAGSVKACLSEGTLLRPQPRFTRCGPGVYRLS